jgi:hypothetical protein
MSVFRNLLGAFMPHHESRRSTATLAVINAELVHDCNGDESAVIWINGTGTANATYQIDGSFDGINFFNLLAFPLPQFCVGGTIPLASQPLISEVVSAATVQRALCVATGQLTKIRVRLTAYTSGSFAIAINSDACASLSPFVRDNKAGTLIQSVTGASGAIVTASLPLVAGMRHYIDRISVLRSLTALQTAAALPTVVTTTNIPNALAFTFGVDAGAQGVDKELVFDFGGAGMACSALATATTISAPATTGVIWRVNVAYRLGL